MNSLMRRSCLPSRPGAQSPIRTAATPEMTAIAMVDACMAVRNAVLPSVASWFPWGPSLLATSTALASESVAMRLLPGAN